MSKAQILSKLVAVNEILSDSQITASDVTNLSTVATTGSYTDLSNKLTTDTLPVGATSKYASPITQFALVHIIRG
jgi:hypothetical protein